MNRGVSEKMSFGETPARRALRENSVGACGAIERNLDRLPRHLVQETFLTSSQLTSIQSTSHVTAADKAGKVMDCVEVKVDSDNDSEKGRHWLEVFVGVLVKYKEIDVAQGIARHYGEGLIRTLVGVCFSCVFYSAVKYADKRSVGFEYFSNIARTQGMR